MASRAPFYRCLDRTDSFSNSFFSLLLLLLLVRSNGKLVCKLSFGLANSRAHLMNGQRTHTQTTFFWIIFRIIFFSHSFLFFVLFLFIFQFNQLVFYLFFLSFLLFFIISLALHTRSFFVANTTTTMMTKFGVSKCLMFRICFFFRGKLIKIKLVVVCRHNGFRMGLERENVTGKTTTDLIWFYLAPIKRCARYLYCPTGTLNTLCRPIRSKIKTKSSISISIDNMKRQQQLSNDQNRIAPNQHRHQNRNGSDSLM